MPMGIMSVIIKDCLVFKAYFGICPIQIPSGYKIILRYLLDEYCMSMVDLGNDFND